jgi:hypothetical protein
MEESKNGRPMIEEALKELDKVLSELSEEANKLKQKIFQEDLPDTYPINWTNYMSLNLRKLEK